jgi:hypothetical protein
VNDGFRKLPQSPEALERQHFEATAKLFELRALLKSRQGLSSGQVGHVRKAAQQLESQIELLELALGTAKVEALASQRAQAEPPKNRHFLQAFYCAAKGQLPAELVARLEQAAASKGGERS